MGCSVNPICYPCQLPHSIRASNWLRPILKSSLGGTHRYSLEKDHKISWTDCRNSTPLHSPFQTMSDSSHHKCLLLYGSSVCFQLSSVQLGRPKAPCKNFYQCPPCKFILRPLVSTPSCLQGTLFTGVEHPLHTKLAYPLNWLKPLATGALTPYFILANMLSKAILSHTPHHFHNTNPSTTSTSGFGP